MGRRMGVAQLVGRGQRALGQQGLGLDRRAGRGQRALGQQGLGLDRCVGVAYVLCRSRRALQQLGLRSELWG